MARSPKKDFHDQENVAGSDMGAAISAFGNLTSGNPVAMASTFTAAFGPVIADVPSMINPSAASKVAAEQRRQQLLAENEERRLRKERERQAELEAKRKKKEEEEKKRLENIAKSQKATKERSLERDTRRIASGLVTQQEALAKLSTGQDPKARGGLQGFQQSEGIKQFGDQVSPMTRRRRRRNRASSKIKGGGTKKVCLPKSKVMSMSPEERRRVVQAKRSAASKGKYKRSSKSFVKGARKKGATLRDWFEKENWVQVSNPSKKCGES